MPIVTLMVTAFFMRLLNPADAAKLKERPARTKVAFLIGCADSMRSVLRVAEA